IFLYLWLPSLSFSSPFSSFSAALFSLSVPYSCLFFLAFLFLFHVQGVVMLRVFLHGFHIFLLFLLPDFFFFLSLFQHLQLHFLLFYFLFSLILLFFRFIFHIFF